MKTTLLSFATLLTAPLLAEPALPLMQKTKDGWVKVDKPLTQIYDEYQAEIQRAYQKKSEKEYDEATRKCLFRGIAAEVADRNNGNSAIYDAVSLPLLELSSENKELNVSTEQVIANLKSLEHDYLHFFVCFHAGYQLNAKRVNAKQAEARK